MKRFKNLLVQFARRAVRIASVTYDRVGPLVFCVTVLIIVAIIPHYVTDWVFELLASCFRTLRGK